MSGGWFETTKNTANDSPISPSISNEPVAGKAYPEKEDDQGIVSIDRANRIVFLSMNSCWEIDHFHKDRSGIHRIALANALDVLDREGCVGEDWLKIAVWHPPRDRGRRPSKTPPFSSSFRSAE